MRAVSIPVFIVGFIVYILGDAVCNNYFHELSVRGSIASQQPSSSDLAQKLCTHSYVDGFVAALAVQHCPLLCTTKQQRIVADRSKVTEVLGSSFIFNW